MAVDLILLHAPSVYDFRKKTILYGPVSDLIPPSPVFEMYPIGLTSIAEYLGKAGYRVRIVNLAVRMMRDKNFDAEKMIQKLKAPIFGIDLHWMVHSHGSIEVARLVKKHHPESNVIFGGFSSTYFHDQLIRYPEIDFVLRGDSTEEPFRMLMDCLRKGEQPEVVPNLTWKDKAGSVRMNPFTNIPMDIENVMDNHFGGVIKSVIRYRDLISYTPVSDWLRYPITAVITCRGCNHNCVICGGSNAAFKGYHHRDKTVFRSPDAIVKNLKQIARFSRGPIFVLGDLYQNGEEYAAEILRLIKENPVKNQLIFELFAPVPKESIQRIAEAAPGFCLEISPESHDYTVRKRAGRNYTNEALEQTIADALEAGCSRMDVFYMTGLPEQDVKSVLETVDYCGYLMEKFKGDKRLAMFLAPISPFLDPGCLGYEQPEKYGYKVLFRDVEQFRQGLTAPSWKYSLDYETEWMTRDEIAESGYEAILRLVKLKAKYGILPPDLAEVGIRRIEEARNMMRKIDEVLAGDNVEEELAKLKPEVDRINAFPVSEKIHLELPMGKEKLRFWNSFWTLVTGRG
ncbi:MAG: TIGR04190 family B12-binding domain/radical SAM domain protein [Dehalococcoidales bacterium]|nr:TIGR04190 family B12-binding domain/radical SAM domain protein [Dehalococcoidales bacterium]